MGKWRLLMTELTTYQGNSEDISMSIRTTGNGVENGT